MSQYKDVHCFFLRAETRAVHHGQDADVFRGCISNSWWCGTKELHSQYSLHSDSGNALNVSLDFDRDLGDYFSQIFKAFVIISHKDVKCHCHIVVMSRYWWVQIIGVGKQHLLIGEPDIFKLLKKIKKRKVKYSIKWGMHNFSVSYWL